MPALTYASPVFWHENMIPKDPHSSAVMILKVVIYDLAALRYIRTQALFTRRRTGPGPHMITVQAPVKAVEAMYPHHIVMGYIQVFQPFQRIHRQRYSPLTAIVLSFPNWYILPYTSPAAQAQEYGPDGNGGTVPMFPGFLALKKDPEGSYEP